MARLDGKPAIVTGAAQGIGATLASALAAEGAHVLVTDISDTSTCVDAIRQSGGTAEGMRIDVTSNDNLNAMVERCEEAFGPVEILVNNAGIFATLDLKPFWEISEDEWDLLMRVNVRGVFQTTKACLPSMKKPVAARSSTFPLAHFFTDRPASCTTWRRKAPSSV